MKSIFALLALAFLFVSCSDDDTQQPISPVAAGEFELTLDARIGSEDFAINKDFTIGNQTFNFKKLRYWVSNVILIDAKGAEYKVPESYYLMEEVGDLNLSGTINDSLVYPAKKRETIKLINIPSGDYKTIRFSIGVDAQHNDNLSLRAGELSIANGMSNIAWMWHSSYIFSAVGGTVKQGSETKEFVAETGLNANYKTISIDLPSPVNLPATKGVTLNLDVTKVLDGINVVQNPKINAMTAALMSTVATNYATKSIAFSKEIK